MRLMGLLTHTLSPKYYECKWYNPKASFKIPFFWDLWVMKHVFFIPLISTLSSCAVSEHRNISCTITSFMFQATQGFQFDGKIQYPSFLFKSLLAGVAWPWLHSLMPSVPHTYPFVTVWHAQLFHYIEHWYVQMIFMKCKKTRINSNLNHPSMR